MCQDSFTPQSDIITYGTVPVPVPYRTVRYRVRYLGTYLVMDGLFVSQLLGSEPTGNVRYAGFVRKLLRYSIRLISAGIRFHFPAPYDYLAMFRIHYFLQKLTTYLPYHF